MNTTSLYHACEHAQQVANETGLPTAVFKPFNHDSYEVVVGRREVNEAEAYENFVQRYVPE